MFVQIAVNLVIWLDPHKKPGCWFVARGLLQLERHTGTHRFAVHDATLITILWPTMWVPTNNPRPDGLVLAVQRCFDTHTHTHTRTRTHTRTHTHTHTNTHTHTHRVNIRTRPAYRHPVSIQCVTQKSQRDKYCQLRGTYQFTYGEVWSNKHLTLPFLFFVHLKSIVRLADPGTPQGVGCNNVNARFQVGTIHLLRSK